METWGRRCGPGRDGSEPGAQQLLAAVSGCWMCRPSSARGSGCWQLVTRIRTIPTMPGRWPSRPARAGRLSRDSPCGYATDRPGWAYRWRLYRASYQAQVWPRAAVRSGASSPGGCSPAGSLTVISGCSRERASESMRGAIAAQLAGNDALARSVSAPDPGAAARRRGPGSTGRPSTGKVIDHDHNPAARQPVHPVGEDRVWRRSAPEQGAGRDLTARRPILPRPPRGVNPAGRSCFGHAAPRQTARAAVSGISRL